MQDAWNFKKTYYVTKGSSRGGHAKLSILAENLMFELSQRHDFLHHVLFSSKGRKQLKEKQITAWRKAKALHVTLDFRSIPINLCFHRDSTS